MKSLPVKIRDGMLLSYHPKVQETARKFMSDNGFKLTPQGKSVACHYVQEVAEQRNYEIEFSVAVQGAIMMLK